MSLLGGETPTRDQRRALAALVEELGALIRVASRLIATDVFPPTTLATLVGSVTETHTQLPPDPLAEEIEALTALLADVVELTRSGAIYPGHFALIAEQAQDRESVQRALRVAGQ